MRTKPVNLSDEEVAFVRSLVIFADEHILALAKPAGISSQGGHRGVNSLDELLAAFAKPSGSRPRLVHRLDRDTSGVLLTARTAPAAAFLGKAMMGRRVRKTYLALVGGPLTPREGAIESALVREDHGRESFVRLARGDEAAARRPSPAIAPSRPTTRRRWSSSRRAPDACTSCASTSPASAGRSPEIRAMAAR